MKIVSWMNALNLFILDDGSAISVNAIEGASVGSTITLKDGVYTLGGAEEKCET